MKILQSLKRGDRVAIAATARKISLEELRPAVALFRSWELEVEVPPETCCEDRQFAGTDLQRAQAFQRLLDNPEIRAIFCARGGYGTVRMVDLVDWSSLLRDPKWIIGYSDVTVLHSHIQRLYGMETLHATMPVNIRSDSHTPAVDTLYSALFCGEMAVQGQSGTFRQGETVAPVVGGNLSILYSLMGSPSEIDTDGKILFIEDLDEYLYHIDRMMQNLKRSGKLSHLKGLIVGALSDMHDNTVPFGKTAEEIVWEAVREYGYPVVMNAPFGHIGDLNQALPLGVPLALEVRGDGHYFIKNISY